MKLFGLENQSGEDYEGLLTLIIIGAILLLLIAIMIFDKMESVRFHLWFKENGDLEHPDPWRTIVPWHRAGSRWYNVRTGGSIHGGNKKSNKEHAAEMNRLYDKVQKPVKVSKYWYR